MVKKPTLLILGAGASIPYGFPDGRTMMLDICEGIMKGSYSQLIVGLDLSDNKLRDFAQEMKISGLASVDAFLESRPQYIDVGKATIAHYLIPYETPGALWPKKRIDGWDKPRWYEYLFQKLKAEAETPKAFCENRLSIITYNYDRSLEHFLFTSIRNTFGLDESAAAQVFSTLPIVHIHGMLSPFAPVNDGRRFTGELSLEALALSAEHLRIIHEPLDDSEGLREARKIVRSHEKMCFLGFGYHPINVRRLEIDFTTKGRLAIYGSVFGLTGLEIDQIYNGLFAKRLLSHREPTDHITKCGNLEYLRHYFPWE